MKSIEREGFKLKYCTEGSGPDVIVIGNALYYSRSFSQNLRQFLRLHFVDYRGFAEGPEGALTFDTLLEDIECFRKRLGIKKSIVVGHSAHALLALEYAKKYGEQVSGVLLIGMPPHMREDLVALAERNWEESVCPKRKAAFDRNREGMPDEQLNRLPRDDWFLQMNFRNVPKSWYNYHFDPRPLWEGVKPNMAVLDQMYLLFVREVDVSQGLESMDIPVLLAYGRFEFLVAPVQAWDSLRPKFKNLTVRIFEKSAHSPQYEEAELFDAELLKWLARISQK